LLRLKAGEEQGSQTKTQERVRVRVRVRVGKAFQADGTAWVKHLGKRKQPSSASDVSCRLQVVRL
jgi:hypothetical protein